ncbi:hypothetical protein tb265_41910 [Gemmatimonadetes bacterium T265]|nr:hypothetical protein tb265_41910 [Gemmatimonadetes bacterium T265]
MSNDSMRPDDLGAPARAGAPPDLSILLISYRRPDDLYATLGDVAAQHAAARVEVVCVLQAYPAGEADRLTQAFAAARGGADPGARGPTELRIVEHAEGLGVHGARNEALRHARGRVVAFLDDDVRLAPDWVATLLPYFDAPNLGGVGGYVWHPGCDAPGVRVLRPLLGMASRRYRVDWGGYHTMPYSGHPDEDQPADWLSGCNMAFRRAALDALAVEGGIESAPAGDGPFVATYGNYGYDDVDVCVRLRAAGWRLVSTQRLAVRHYPSATNRPVVADLVRAEEERRVAFVRRAIGDRAFWRARYVARTALNLVAATVYGIRKREPGLAWDVAAGAWAGLRRHGRDARRAGAARTVGAAALRAARSHAA